uniref:glucose-6-phosphate 1-epimerase n=1 Tax=Hyaloperonospora arabidopsidis (strain Emoy2) TaxID=559515 RepID=M4BMU8_HYAAE
MVLSSLFKTAALVSSTLLASSFPASLGATYAAPQIVHVTHMSGSSAEISTLGVQVISFYTSHNPDVNVLFMNNDQSAFDGKNPIQGGATAVFPNYGPPKGHSAPTNGFARTMVWNFASMVPAPDATKPTYAVFDLTSSDATMQLWPFAFRLMYEVHLWPSSLEITFTVINTHTTAISFDLLLQNYFAVRTIRDNNVMISGLKGYEFLDRITNKVQIDERDSFGIPIQVDIIHKNVNTDVVAHVKGEQGNRNFIVQAAATTGDGAHTPAVPSTDRTVWNRWNTSTANLADFGDDKYLRTIAIGSGRVSEMEVLYPSLRYALNQVITVETV